MSAAADAQECLEALFLADGHQRYAKGDHADRAQREYRGNITPKNSTTK